MKIIENELMPPPAKGHYSHCVEHNGILYLSGQLPLLPDGTVPEGIEPQTLLTLQKVEKILQAAGSKKEQILRMTVYITDIAYWPEVNAAYADFFGNHKPARCIIPCGKLNYGALIEIDCTAFV
jgi:2-iminobutanoate/2-iminopropanoate deaminase